MPIQVGPSYWPNLVNRVHPLNVGRVAWWLTRAGRGSDAVWYDLMGSYHGTLKNGPTWQGTSRPGGWGSLLLDGSNDYVSIPAANLFLSAVTVAAWVYFDPPGATPGEAAIIGRWGSQWLLEPVSGFPRFYVAGRTTATSSTLLPLRVWTRVSATYDGTTARVYLNGAEIGSATGTTGNLQASTANVEIGSYGGGILVFPGRIDDVSIWNRALSVAEIAALYDISCRGYPGVLNTRRPSVLLSYAASIPTVVTRSPARLAKPPTPAFRPGARRANGLRNFWALADRGSPKPGNAIGGPALAIVGTPQPAWVGAPDGGAVQFDGPTGHAQYASAPVPAAGLKALTVAFRLRLDTWTAAGGVFQWADVLNSGGPFILVQWTTATTIQVYANGGYRLTATVASGGWHDYAITADGATWNLYLDGNLAGTYAGGIDDGGSAQPAATGLYLGSGYPDYGAVTASCLAVWDRALTATEMRGQAADPYAPVRPRRALEVIAAATVPPSFRPAWASRPSPILGGGVC